MAVPGDDSVENSIVNPEHFIRDMAQLAEAAKRMRWEEEREWLKAWSFYKGRHWVTWREDRLVEMEQQKLPKITLNFVMNVVQTRLGHLTKNKPMWQGVPASADEESRNATRLGLKVLEAYHHRLRMVPKLTKAILHMLVTGIAYLKPGWDPLAGGSYSRTLSNGQALTGPLGDVFCDVVKAWELLVEPGCDDIDSAQRVIHETFMPIGQAFAKWPKLDKEKIQPIDPSTRENRALLEAQFGTSATASSHNRVLVQECYYRKGTPRDDGGGTYERPLCAVVVNGTELATSYWMDEGMPEIPFVRLAEVEADGFYSTSTARQLVDMNKILDVEFSHQEYNRKVMRPKTLLPYQAQIQKDAWDQDDSELVEFFHPYAPTAYTPPALPAHHIEGRNTLVQMLKELGGNFDVLSGKAATDVRSGRMVSYLQEYAGTVLGVVASNIESAYEDLGNMLLQIVQQRVTEERMVPLVGSNRRMEILAFKGTDLKSMAGVWVQTGSALPISRAERQDRIEGYIEKGWIEPKKGLRMLSIADPDSDVYADDEQDREIADEVIYKLKALKPDALKQAMQAGQAAAEQRMALAPPPMPMPAAPSEPGMPPPPPMAPGPVPFGERDVLRALKIEAFEFEDHSTIVEHMDKAFRKTRYYREAPLALRALADAYCDWHVLLAAGRDPDHPEVPQGGLLTKHRPRPPGQPPPPLPGSEDPASGPSGAADPGQEQSEGLPPVRATAGPDKAAIGEETAP